MLTETVTAALYVTVGFLRWRAMLLHNRLLDGIGEFDLIEACPSGFPWSVRIAVGIAKGAFITLWPLALAYSAVAADLGWHE